MSELPKILYHVTTAKKVKRYHQAGKIIGPVRGFDTLMGAMAWAMKTGRKVILEVRPFDPVQMMPDHHNKYGKAYWTNSVGMNWCKCEYSAEGSFKKVEGI